MRIIIPLYKKPYEEPLGFQRINRKTLWRSLITFEARTISTTSVTCSSFILPMIIVVPFLMPSDMFDNLRSITLDAFRKFHYATAFARICSSM